MMNELNQNMNQPAEEHNDQVNKETIEYWLNGGININDFYQRRIIELFKRAQQNDQNDSEAQYRLGMCFYLGDGVKQDFGEAVRWLELASNQNHPVALNELGEMFRDGKGVPQDYQKAKECFEKGVELDFPPAYKSLSDMYYSGLGVMKDIAKANELLWRMFS